MPSKTSIYLITLIVFASICSCGCFGNDESPAENTIEVKTETKADIFLKKLETTNIGLEEIGTQTPDTLDSLTTYGISKVTRLYHPETKTFGWRYEFATARGCQLYTEKVIATPEYSIGIHGDVTGKVVLLGAVPSYYFTNEQSHHYVTPIGNILIILSGSDLPTTYTDSQIITQIANENAGNPSSTIGVDQIDKQIYPKKTNASGSSESGISAATIEQQIRNGDYTSFFS